MNEPTFLLRSEKLKTDYRLYVESPAASAPLSLVLVMDGDDQFTAARHAATKLMREGAVPPLLLVGVGYGASYASPRNRRVRDYTPTQPKDEPMESGGAGNFLEFLSQSLIPELRLRYKFRPENIGIMGHSLGSLLGLYALTQAASPFRRYLVSAPSTWWDDRSVLAPLKNAANDSGRLAVKAWFGIGAEDSPSMVSDFALLEKQLTKHPLPETSVAFATFPGYNHYNALNQTFVAGLTWLYGERR